MPNPSHDPTETPSRYVVGIDLGTTNSAVAFVDTADDSRQVTTLPVPQLVAPGVVERRETLPSFHYQPAAAELAPGALRLPFSVGAEETPDYAVGFLARDLGALVPGRLVASAKSWLCHAGVDRLADLLPWHGAADVERHSPIEISGRYLAHIRGAWNERFPEFPLETQEVVLTLPASFDEVARELTVKAAARAGLARVVLIEEPQAAIYQWIDAHRHDWQELVSPGQKILICDVGGGTADFTLVVVGRDSRGQSQFHRVAVGEHLILGGDNFDLALAHHVEQKLTGGQTRLEPRQWAALVQSCRQAKESLLADDAPATRVVTLPGTGSRLIGGGLQVELAREEVQELLVEGFFPRVALDDKPAARRSGFQEFGLPYAPDAALTRYLAAFLTAHRHVPLPGGVPESTARDRARPDIVLLNGGVFDAVLLRQRLLEVIGSWFSPAGGGWQPQVLENERRDLAVARGAAYYGLVRRGIGVRIAAGLARSYFIGAAAGAAGPTGVCLLPAGTEEGQAVELERSFELLIRQPAEFPLFVSSTRLTCRAGEVVPVDPEQMTALPPIRTVLASGKKTAAADSVSVALHARLSEIGTLELWCSERAGERTWKLAFDVRSATRTDLAGHLGAGEQAGIVDGRVLDACRALVAETFGPAASRDREQPERLVKRLAEASELARHAWPPSLLRELWQVLFEFEAGRKKSALHEARWLGLLGFGLRPGYGMAVDDWRVAQTRRLLGGLVFNTPANRAEWWILWRRLSGGLPAGQQRSLGEPLVADIRAWHRAVAKGRGADFKAGSHEAAELWRLVGSLELLGIASKSELGAMLIDLAPREKVAAVHNAAVWALGRIGARVPLYGPLNTVAPAEMAAQWAERLMALKRPAETTPLALMQLARRTDDRYRDVPESVRHNVLAWFAGREVPPHFVELVAQGGDLAAAEQGLVFGESLPQGLRLA